MGYAKFYDAYWEGEKIEPLSDRACLLGAYLINGKHRNAIGCFKLGIGAITDIPRFGKWGIEGVSEALREMMQTGFIVRDERTGWTLIPNALVKDPIKGPKGAIHAAKLAANIPASSIVYPNLKQILEPQLEVEKKALLGTEGWPMRDPIEGVSNGDVKPKRSPNPDPVPLPVPVPEPVKPNRSSADPLEAGLAIEAWNDLSQKFGSEIFPRVQKITAARRARAVARLRDCGGLTAWHEAMARVGASSFLRGEQRSEKHKNWRCDFEFITKDQNFTKLMEGGYDDRTHGSGGGTPGDSGSRDAAILRGLGLGNVQGPPERDHARPGAADSGGAEGGETATSPGLDRANGGGDQGPDGLGGGVQHPEQKSREGDGGISRGAENPPTRSAEPSLRLDSRDVQIRQPAADAGGDHGHGERGIHAPPNGQGGPGAREDAPRPQGDQTRGAMHASAIGRTPAALGEFVRTVPYDRDAELDDTVSGMNALRAKPTEAA